jgi:hypothetical protein
MNISILTPVATGVAVADREAGSTTLKVKPLELLPNLNGRIKGEEQLIDIEVNTPQGLVPTKLKLKSFITANWFNQNSNRLTPPDIMAGERVLILRQGNSTNYYWEPLDIDNHLRQTERIVIAISNTNRGDRADKVLTKDNCYFIELDTVNKHLTVTTNKNDGEPFAYELKLNTLAGFLRLKDDVGNHVLMDSANTHIQLINKDKTEYSLNKKDIYEYCEGNHTRIVKGNLLEEVSGTRTRKVTKDETIEAANYQYTSKGNYNVKSSVNNFDTPVSNFNGQVVAASVSFGPGKGAPGAAASSGGPTVNISGETVMDGNLTSTGTIEASKVKAATGEFDSHGPH